METIILKPVKMVTKITPTTQGTYTVNGKEVYRDIKGNWVARDFNKFTSSELRAWRYYMKVVLERSTKDLTMTIHC